MSPISKIMVYSQTRKRRLLVGALWREGSTYVFEYNRGYQKQKSAVSLGPELPLWQKRFSSQTLFASIADRLPSRENPAYVDYCKQWGIDPAEKDVMTLLTTIGRRGPSTFVFEPAVENEYSGADVKKFRKRLHLSQEEFRRLFDLSHNTLQRLEQEQSESASILHYIELCDKVPEAFSWVLRQRGQTLHDDKRAMLEAHRRGEI